MSLDDPRNHHSREMNVYREFVHTALTIPASQTADATNLKA